MLADHQPASTSGDRGQRLFRLVDSLPHAVEADPTRDYL